MSWSISPVSGPASEPVTVDEALEHLRVDGTADKALIASQIVAARQWLEEETRRAFLTQSFDLILDAFPADGEPIRLKRGKVSAVASVKYYDTAGTLQTWSTSNYTTEIAGLPGRVVPGFGVAWPALQLGRKGGVQVRFSAGYGDAAALVPRPLVQALLLVLGNMYEHRESIVAGAPTHEIAMTVRSLIGPYRVWD